ncbi:hypothetical protein K0B03_03525, partial [Patescibacteria group bacterium]|nr:hypothetical protein [Patescibacteria group bacterium]
MSSDFRKPNSGSKKEDKITSSTSSISNGSNSDSSVSLTEEQKRKLVDTIKEKVNEGIEKNKLDLENEDIRPSLSEQGTSGDMGKNALLTSALIQKAMEKVEATQKPYDYSSNPHINVDAQRQEKINQYRQEARKKAEKEVERETAHMQNAKARIALKIAGKHLDDIAFSIAEKMAAQANRGGLHAVMPIMTTYFLALLKDSGDLILTLLNLTGIGAIVGTVLAFL